MSMSHLEWVLKLIGMFDFRIEIRDYGQMRTHQCSLQQEKYCLLTVSNLSFELNTFTVDSTKAIGTRTSVAVHSIVTSCTILTVITRTLVDVLCKTLISKLSSNCIKIHPQIIIKAFSQLSMVPS